MRKLGPIIVAICALALGVAAMLGLTAYGRSQQTKGDPPAEETLHVRAAVAEPGSYPVQINGFGSVSALRTVAIVPEVSGQILETHPSFIEGGDVSEGDVLLRIDPVPYQTALSEAEAALRQQQIMIERLRQEWETEKLRHAALEQTAALSERDHARAIELARKGVGSKVEVDRAERAKVEAASARDLHARELEIFPLRIQEAEALTDTVRAAADRARRSVEQTEVKAPYTGSIAAKMVDVGQYVAAGVEVARLEDHSALEIMVPIDSQDARQWLRYTNDAPADSGEWFPRIDPVECQVFWTEDEAAPPWRAELNRVAGYDQQTRMLNVVVRHKPEAAGFPMVTGMFCRVQIPGRSLEGVYRLPRESVTFDDHVYVSVDGRLKMKPVVVAREDEGYAFVSEGIDRGDVVVLTRLVDALDNTLLKIDMEELPTGADSPMATPLS